MTPESVAIFASETQDIPSKHVKALERSLSWHPKTPTHGDIIDIDSVLEGNKPASLVSDSSLLEKFGENWKNPGIPNIMIKHAADDRYVIFNENNSDIAEAIIWRRKKANITPFDHFMLGALLGYPYNEIIAWVQSKAKPESREKDNILFLLNDLSSS